MATIKQKLAFKKIVETRGSVSTAMRAVGYEDNTAKNPKNLTDSKGWQGLIDKYISEEALIKVHSEGLKATRKQFKNNNESGEIEEVANEPDYAVRHKYLETGYKVRGKLKEQDDKPKGNTYNIFIAEQRERIARRVLARDAGSETTLDRLLDSNEPEV